MVSVPDLRGVTACDAASAARSIDDGLAVLGVLPRPRGSSALPAPAVRGRAAQILLAAAGGLEAWTELDEGLLGAMREDRMANPERRARGAHATPAIWAATLARNGLSVLDEGGAGRAWLDTRIVDPAAGGAALLIAAGTELSLRVAGDDAAGQSSALRGEIVKRCLFGVDRDEDAVRVAHAALALWGAGRGGTAPQVHVAVGDPLLACDVDTMVDGFVPRPARRPSDALRRDLSSALVEGFFSRDPMTRIAERKRVIAIARRACIGDLEAREDLTVRADKGRTRGAFHPALAWGGETRAAGFDLALMNPPFLGGKRIGTVLGPAYADWLGEREPHTTGNADLAAHFLLAARRWLAPRAALAIVATNTIAEGATRDAGLGRLVHEGFVIAAASRGERWPGRAAVSVVRVVVTRDLAPTSARLDGAAVAHIDAGLRAAMVRPEPAPLAENRGLGFIGCYVRGDGFLLDDGEARRLLEGDPKLGTCLRPYLIGEDVMRHPARLPSRWVIDFGGRTLDEAREFPELLAIVEERVRPTREALPPTSTNRPHRVAWWRFANVRSTLRARLEGKPSCLVAARVAKHLVFVHADPRFMFSEQLVVVPRSDAWMFAVLASGAHLAWARAHSSSLQDGLRYLPSRVLATFPFPEGSRRDLETCGTALRQARDTAASSLNVGLSTLRDRVEAGDQSVGALRDAEDAVDRAVLAAYGWSDLERPRNASSSRLPHDDAKVVERLADENTRRARRGKAETALV